MENKQEELRGIIKEMASEVVSKDIEEIKADAEAQKEANAKVLETNVELKARMDAMQDKVVSMATKTAGTQQYVFKGYNPELSKNFKSTLSTDECNEVAKIMVDQVKRQESGSIFKAYDAANAIPVQYGSSIMGLAELSSVSLANANVVVADSPVIKLPAKGTREAVDAVTPGSANVEGVQTIGQITWTIDKIVGTYIELLTTQIDDANFDIVNQVIIPMQSEAMGQKYDSYMFNSGGEYTSSITDASASVTTSGTVATAAAITFANLNKMFYSLEWERGIMNPKWYGSRATLKDISGILDGNSRPLFQQVPINGRPSQVLMGCEYVITPVMDDTPDNGKIRLAFGDANHYRIFLRGSAFKSMVNPYVLMKESKVQFICQSRSDGNISDTATPSSSGAWTTLKRVDS